jgi:hypothetical protein
MHQWIWILIASDLVKAIIERPAQRCAVPASSGCISPVRPPLWPAPSARGFGFSGNDLEISLCGLIGLAAMLLPIAPGPERDAKSLGELGLRQAQAPANTLCQRDPTKGSNAAGAAVLDRQRIGIGPGLGQNLLVRLSAQSSPLLACHPMRVLIDPHLAAASSLRCGLSAHAGMPFAPESQL